jgi:hypothetical protein
MISTSHMSMGSGIQFGSATGNTQNFGYSSPGAGRGGMRAGGGGGMQQQASQVLSPQLTPNQPIGQPAPAPVKTGEPQQIGATAASQSAMESSRNSLFSRGMTEAKSMGAMVE